jgi:hypothetical protein
VARAPWCWQGTKADHGVIRFLEAQREISALDLFDGRLVDVREAKTGQ